MALGVDTLIKSLFSACGFDPVELMQGMQQFVTFTHGKLVEFDERSARVEQTISAMVQSLESLHEKLAAMDRNGPTVSVPVSPVPPILFLESPSDVRYVNGASDHPAE